MICAVALVLLLDGSGSMERDFPIQREQTAAALESPEVLDAIQRGDPIALSVMQFSTTTRVEVDWTVVRTAQDVRNVAARVRQIRFVAGTATHIATALTDATAQVANLTQCQPDSTIIDLSTDGIDPYVDAIGSARDAAQIAGVRINVIAVGLEEDANLLREYAVTQDGFVLHTESWANYPALFRRKIVFELAGLTP